METDDIDILFNNVPDYDFDENEPIVYEESPKQDEPDLYAYELYHTDPVVEPGTPMDPRHLRYMQKLNCFSKSIAEMRKILMTCVEQIADLKIYEAIREPDDIIVLKVVQYCDRMKFTLVAPPDFFYEGPFSVNIHFKSQEPRSVILHKAISMKTDGTATFFFKEFKKNFAVVESAELCVCAVIDKKIYDKCFKTYDKIIKKNSKLDVVPELPPPKSSFYRKPNICNAFAAMCMDRKKVSNSSSDWAPLLQTDCQNTDDVDNKEDIKPVKAELDALLQLEKFRELPSDLQVEKPLILSPIFQEKSFYSSDSDSDNDESGNNEPVIFELTNLFDTGEDVTTNLMDIMYSIPLEIRYI